MAKDEDQREEHEEEDREPELVVVEEGSEEHRAAQEHDEDDEEHEDGDERLGRTETSEEERQLYGRRKEGETDEQYRERRRKERAQKKANRKAAINRSRTELRYLESRNDQLEREQVELKKRLAAVEGRTAQTHAVTIDGRISQAESQLEEAKNLKAAALEANNGTDVVKCDEIIDHLNHQLRNMRAYKEHLAKGGQAPQPNGQQGEEIEQPRRVQRVAPPPDPKVAAHSQAFQERLDWFDPQGRNPESATVYAIDQALAKDGRFDPRTKKYWDELERRVRAALPHKFEEDDLDDVDDPDDNEESQRPQNKGRGGPRIPGGNRGSARGNNTFYISKERKEALMEMGVWDDKKLRDKYIRKFREWDQQNAGSR